MLANVIALFLLVSLAGCGSSPAPSTGAGPTGAPRATASSVSGQRTPSYATTPATLASASGSGEAASSSSKNVRQTASREEAAISHQTQWCLTCHRNISPGIVTAWKQSRHASTTPAGAQQKEPLARRISTKKIASELQNVVVGCYECHGLRTSEHEDSFRHNGSTINVIVSPRDCAVCHEEEATQYAGSKKAHAYENLAKNPLFTKLMGAMLARPPSAMTTSTQNVTCYACHGAPVEVVGRESVSRGIPVMLPVLSNWPNQGVGRINPDGSRGSCTSCHPRHRFSIETARKPQTCSQCHLAPDFPAWNVYRESKHGNIVLSGSAPCQWNAVPWTAGVDFTAPTCASCHVSLLADSKGRQLVARSHDFGARLWVRLAGFIYAAPHPKTGATYELRNSDGLPLPTSYDGTVAHELLIDEAEMEARKGEMTKVCLACHGTHWTRTHFRRLDDTVAETNRLTKESTALLLTAWNKGLVDERNPFDEPLEFRWLKQWLFYGNSIRYGAAMAGPDYATFHGGWAQLTNNHDQIKKSSTANR